LTVDLEIICIGNELLIGKILNTNSHWLAKEATNLAVNVKRITVVRDTLEEISRSILEAIARKPHFIITTGGLGPTFDDMTLQGVAKALDRKLEVNPKALGMVKERCIQYAKKHDLPTLIELTKPRIKMATFPENTTPINNPQGTAPGLHVKVQDTMVFVLPGVPSEMESIFKETIMPVIREATGGLAFCQRSVFLLGIIESALAPLIDKVMVENKGVYIKSHPLGMVTNQPRIELHLTITTKQLDNPESILDDAISQLTSLVEQTSAEVKVSC